LERTAAVEEISFRPEVLDHLNQLHGLLESEESLQSTLERIAQLATVTIPGCDSGGVTVMQKGKPSTAGATDDFTLKIDADQYGAGQGPCLQAFEQQQVVAIKDIADETRWPRFVAAAARDGLRSSLSLPLAVRDKPVGALNLYSRSTEAFRPDDEALSKLFASQAALALSNAQTYEAALILAEQLKEAIKSREVIGQAKGVIMEREQVSDQEAFQMLVRVSQNSNVKVRDVAQKIVDDAVAARHGA
jgi:GAF domain-containing protein